MFRETDREVETEVSAFLSPLRQDISNFEIVCEKELKDHEVVESPCQALPEDFEEVVKNGTTEANKNLCACENYMGIFLTLGSGLIFTIAGLIVKYLKDYHPVSLAVFRFQGVLVPALVLALYSHYVKREQVFSTIWPLTNQEQRRKFIFTGVRGTLGGTALILLFYSIQNLSLADALVISSCRPVFVTVVAHVFLGEPCGIFPAFAALLSVVGVGFITRPPVLTGDDHFNEDTVIGAGFAFIGMLTAAVSMVVLRYLRGVHVSMVTFTFGVYGTLISVVSCSIIGRFDMPSTAEEIALVACLATTTFFAQVGITLAMRYEQAGAVAIIRSCDTIFAFILQFLVFGTLPDNYSLIGAALIFSCVIMIAFRKWISTLSEKNPLRKRYWFVLK